MKLMPRHSRSKSYLSQTRPVQAAEGPILTLINKLFNQLTPLVLLALAISVGFFSIKGKHGLQYLGILDNRLEEISQKNDSLLAEISGLEYKIHSIKQKGYYLEKLAREELGLSRAGETIYLFR